MAGLVGRESEVARLHAGLDSVLAGVPRVVLCGGEPGIGKTRLAEELVETARRRGVSTVWGRSVESAGAPPCWPWRQVLRTLSARDGGIAGELGVAKELAVVAPEAFPDVPAEPVDLDGSPERRFRVFDAVTRYLHGVAADGLVVVLDDVHRADVASLMLLRHVVGNLGATSLMVVATYRDTEPAMRSLLADLLRESGTSRVGLTGLSRDAVGSLLADLTGHAVDADTVGRVHELTGGNPFFVGELAHSLDAGVVPDTVRGAVRGRMDRLSPRCRHQLRVAAVLGRTFEVAVVAAVIGQPLLSCLDAWDEAEGAGMVVAAERGEYRFTHALSRDAIYADLSAEERSRLHRDVAGALETYHADDLDPHLAELARHWALVADGGHRAAGWARLAGDEAMSRLSYEEAARLYRQALDVKLDDLVRYDLLVSLARALSRSADLAEAFDVRRQAAALARRIERPDLLAEAALVLDPTAVVSLDAGTHELCREAAAALGPEPTALRARVLAGLAQTSVYVGEPADALSAEALAVAERDGDPVALTAALRARHMARTDPTGTDERGRLAARLLELGDRTNSAASRVQGYSWRIDVRFARGDLLGVAADLENLDWWVGRAGGPSARWHLLRYRAALAQARGAFPEARRLADAAFDAVAPLRHPAAFPVRMALLVTVDHHCGADPQAPHVRACRDTGPGSAATPGHAFRIMDYLGPALVLQEAGHLDEAAAKFHALGPVPTWRVPPFHQLIMYAFGIMVGIRAGAHEAVADLRDLLAPLTGRHVVSGTSVEHYCGPVELYLGTAAAFLGELDTAADELSAAIRVSEAAGAPAHAVEARAELATVRARRGDSPEALARRAIRDADALGMAPWRAKLARLLDAPAGGLTPREHEVAVAVARGLTNRQIAAELHLSERTAQNHVQHILTKLGFTNRSQIAVWVTANPSTSGE